MKTKTSIFLIFIIIQYISSVDLPQGIPEVKFCEYNPEEIEILKDKIFVETITPNGITIMADRKKALGSGSFGKVYDLGEGKALKLIKQFHYKLNELSNELKIHELFKNEVISLSHLESCYYYKSNVDRKIHFFLIMDNYKTGSLFKIIETTISESLMWKFDNMYKITKDLKIMHDKGYAHLDIKMENIFYMNIYTPILGDFGISLDIANGESHAKMVGTQPYAAPETYLHKYDLKTDIYALGVLFYEILNSVVSEAVMELPDMSLKEDSSEIYKIFYPLIKDMVSTNNADRPNIDTVMSKLLNNLWKIADILSEHAHEPKVMKYIPFEKYLIYEKNTVKKETENLVVVRYKTILTNELKAKDKLYKKYKTKQSELIEEENLNLNQPSIPLAIEKKETNSNSDTLQPISKSLIKLSKISNSQKDNSEETPVKIITSINNFENKFNSIEKDKAITTDLNTSLIEKKINIINLEKDKNINELKKSEEITQLKEKVIETKNKQEVEVNKSIKNTEVIKPIEKNEVSEFVEINEITKPLEKHEDIKPVEINEIIQPIEIIEDIKPLEINEVIQPVKINEDIKPIEIIEVTKPVENNEVTKPVKINEFPEFMQINKVSKPVEKIEIIKTVENNEITKPKEILLLSMKKNRDESFIKKRNSLLKNSKELKISIPKIENLTNNLQGEQIEESENTPLNNVNHNIKENKVLIKIDEDKLGENDQITTLVEEIKKPLIEEKEKLSIKNKIDEKITIPEMPKLKNNKKTEKSSKTINEKDLKTKLKEKLQKSELKMSSLNPINLPKLKNNKNIDLMNKTKIQISKDNNEIPKNQMIKPKKKLSTNKINIASERNREFLLNNKGLIKKDIKSKILESKILESKNNLEIKNEEKNNLINRIKKDKLENSNKKIDLVSEKKKNESNIGNMSQSFIKSNIDISKIIGSSVDFNSLYKKSEKKNFLLINKMKLENLQKKKNWGKSEIKLI